MPLPRARNSRVDDLLLLAKNHYTCPAGRVEGARRIVSFHNLWSFDIGIGDAAHVVLHDLLPIVLPTLKPDQASRMLLQLGPRPLLGSLIEREGGVYEALISMVMQETVMLPARADDGTVLMTLPAPDPFLKLALIAADPNDAATLAAA